MSEGDSAADTVQTYRKEDEDSCSFIVFCSEPSVRH